MGARNRQRPSWIRGRDAIKILNGLYPRSPRTPQSSSMIRGAAKASWKLDVVIAKMTLLLETAGDDVVIDRGLIERTLAVIGRVAVGLDWLQRITREFLE